MQSAMLPMRMLTATEMGMVLVTVIVANRYSTTDLTCYKATWTFMFCGSLFVQNYFPGFGAKYQNAKGNLGVRRDYCEPVREDAHITKFTNEPNATAPINNQNERNFMTCTSFFRTS